MALSREDLKLGRFGNKPQSIQQSSSEICPTQTFFQTTHSRILLRTVRIIDNRFMMINNLVYT